jgi:prepilin-type N-terminal cleavage/methylation domain-containing protein
MKRAFTLAEVLITLGIIGVVAALTMPSLVANYQEKATVTRLKKLYSIFSQASALTQEEHGPVSSWVDGQTFCDANNAIAANLKPYLKIVKDCAYNGGCFDKNNQLYLSGNVSTGHVGLPKNDCSYYTMILSDGTSLSLSPYLAGKFAMLVVDIDGPKGANTYGKDIFKFNMTDTGISPDGSGKFKAAGTALNTHCGMNTDNMACTGWVVENENMDYLHCNDLSWGGKTKCD